ncbi:MAG: fructosamine kinase family protein [Chloroflexota bacterium]|jgi:fructosamine-3-kinase
MMAKANGRLGEQIAAALGADVTRIAPLSGGSVAQVYRVELVDGTRLVAKQDGQARGKLALEGQMLRYLKANSRLPVPDVLYNDDDLLLMAFVDGRSQFDAGSRRHAAELLAELHAITADQYGFEYDTLIGGLHQPNPWSGSWLSFFRDQRLLSMGRQALDAGRLPATLLSRLERFAGQLERWLEEPERPSLIHGDAWTGNILAANGRITAFLDPAIYFADAEIELAFTTLFGTFGRRFFDRYQEIRPIRPGFMQRRKTIYNLYPLLVHVRLFGGSYVQSVSQSLSELGY